MSWDQRLHSLVFHHDYTFHQHIRRKITNHDAVIVDLNRLFAFDAQLRLPEFMCQCFLIHRLQKPRPQRAMHFHGTANDRFCELLVFHKTRF